MRAYASPRWLVPAALLAASCAGLSGCASRQVEGWFDASRNADIANFEGIVTAGEAEPQSRGIAAMRTLGMIARARYQLDHLASNTGGFERAPGDWDRMTIDVLSAYGIARRLASLPIGRLARGRDDAEIAAGLDEIRRVVGRWGGAPEPTSGTRRIRP